jgi:hypothetical protein
VESAVKPSGRGRPLRRASCQRVGDVDGIATSGGDWNETTTSGGDWNETTTSGGDWNETTTSGGDWNETATSGGDVRLRRWTDERPHPSPADSRPRS